MRVLREPHEAKRAAARGLPRALMMTGNSLLIGTSAMVGCALAPVESLATMLAVLRSSRRR